jgi:hypothetical protein
MNENEHLNLVHRLTDFFELILSRSAAIGKPGASTWVNAGNAEALVTVVRARCAGQNLSPADCGGRFHINDDRAEARLSSRS